MNTHLFWFRNNLRIHDNALLNQAAHAALQGQSTLLCFFIHDPESEHMTMSGQTRMGRFRRQFLREALDDLSLRLQQLGNELIELGGDSLSVVKDLVDQYQARNLAVATECAPNERRQLSLLRAMCPALTIVTGIENTFTDLDALGIAISEVPDVFTKFRLIVEKSGQFPAAEAAVKTLPAAPNDVRFLKHLATSVLTQSKQTDVRSLAFGTNQAPMNAFVGGESAALNHVHHYFEQSSAPSTYFETRNSMMGQFYATQLSPWLANGSLSVRYAHQLLLAYETKFGANKSTYWIKFEWLWRDFFRIMALKYGVNLFKLQGIRTTEATSFKRDPKETEKLRQWILGNTQEPFVNACMRELGSTGWLSNRGRQIVASYLVHSMGVRWIYGAQYFESVLVDYDACSNWGNWAYLAGVGNDPRGTRYFDVQKQARTYDPDGEYQLKFGKK